MSDKILLLLFVLSLGYGGYKLISTKLAPPAAPAEAPKPAIETAPAVASIPTTEEIPEEKPPEVKKVLPPKISKQELTQLFRVDGTARGADGFIVMINNTPLHEGEILNDLRIEKIMDSHVEVSYKGHTYQLGQQLLPTAIN